MIRPRDLTPAGLVVVVSLMILVAVVLMVTLGCDRVPIPSPVATPPIPSTVVARETKIVEAPAPGEIPAAAVKWRKTFARAWQYYFDLAEPVSIGFAQVHQESRWKADARSPVGAQGLGQFMPATADWIQELLPPEVQAGCGAGAGCPLDPKWALEAVARFDYFLHHGYRWAPTQRDRWGFTLAAYNGGAGWIVRERNEVTRQGKDDRIWFGGAVEVTCLRSASACRENRDYPRSILDRWRPLYIGWLGE